MANTKNVREYVKELIISTMKNTIPPQIPEFLSVSELVNIACKGQMQYLIFNSLIKVCGECDEFGFIKRSLYQSTVKTFLQTVMVKKISNAFENEGIRHQMLKGAVMKGIYPSPEMREMSDIDLVVYDENLDKAAKVLEDMGFTNHGLIKHHMIFSNNDVIIEVHWCLFDASAGRDQYIYFKDNFRAKLKAGTNYTYEFNTEDFYVYMIAHMAKHFFETGCGIRNLVDIYVFINRYGEFMNKDYLNKELTNCGILDFERYMREMAFIWLDDKECIEFFENLFEYMLNSGIYGKLENGIWGQLAKETANGEKGIIIHYYFPSIRFMKEKYAWLEKRPYLLPIAWVIRGVAGISNQTGKAHKEMISNADEHEIQKMLEIYHRLNLGFRR